MMERCILRFSILCRPGKEHTDKEATTGVAAGQHVGDRITAIAGPITLKIHPGTSGQIVGSKKQGVKYTRRFRRERGAVSAVVKNGWCLTW